MRDRGSERDFQGPMRGSDVINKHGIFKVNSRYLFCGHMRGCPTKGGPLRERGVGIRVREIQRGHILCGLILMFPLLRMELLCGTTKSTHAHNK